MREFLKKRGLILGLVAVIIVLITVFSLFLTGGRVSFLQNGFNVMMRPVETGIRNLVSGLERLYGYMYNYDTMEAELQGALDTLAEYEQKVRRAEEVEEEIQRLNELLEFKDRTNTLRSEPAYVISWDASNWTSAFTIDAGRDAGLEVGDPVITSRNELVGMVTEVGSNWATVRTIIDSGSRVGALLGSGVSAVAEGDFSLMQQGRLRLSYVPSSEMPLLEDSVISSGLGEVIPKGMEIGTIVQVEMEDSGASYYAVIEPAADLPNLTQVFVVKEYELKE